MTIPGRQFMVSSKPIADTEKGVEWCRSACGATDADIIIKDMKETYPYEQKDGLHCRYTVEWFTPIGWKTYMLLTGCIVSIPQSTENFS